jgi:hypothetical protein
MGRVLPMYTASATKTVRGSSSYLQQRVGVAERDTIRPGQSMRLRYPSHFWS